MRSHMCERRTELFCQMSPEEKASLIWWLSALRHTLATEHGDHIDKLMRSMLAGGGMLADAPQKQQRKQLCTLSLPEHLPVYVSAGWAATAVAIHPHRGPCC